MNLGIISTVESTASWAGSEEAWRLVSLDLAGHGHSIHASLARSFSGSLQAQELVKAGVRLHPRAPLTTLPRRLATKGLFSRFGAFASARFDLLLISVGGIADLYWQPDLLRALVRRQSPFAVIVQANSETSITTEHQRSTLRQVYAQARRCIFVSRHNLELAKRQFAFGFPNAELLVNPLRDDVPVPLPWPDSKTIGFATVARLDLVDKQQDVLLETLASEIWKGRDWQLTFYGAGVDQAHLSRLISFYGLMDRAHIEGFVPDFRQIWRSNHLHILPSRTEGMPLALIESMACGRPAVVTRAGGSPELIVDGVCGFITTGMDSAALDTALSRAWATQPEWPSLGARAHERIRELGCAQGWSATFAERLVHLVASP